MLMNGPERAEMFVDMARYVGKTVTIFTASGGISGEVVIIGLSKTNPIKTGFANLVLFFSQARLKKLTNKKH